MSDNLYHKVVAKAGKVIDETWLRLHMQELEELPVYAAFGWGWTHLMADGPVFRQEISLRSQAAFQSKPFGCELCEEKEATKYHPYAGRVCADCYETLPKE